MCINSNVLYEHNWKWKFDGKTFIVEDLNFEKLIPKAEKYFSVNFVKVLIFFFEERGLNSNKLMGKLDFRKAKNF